MRGGEMSIEVQETIKNYLKDNGFDGLFSVDGGCACILDDLFPCSEFCLIFCQPGYKAACACGDHDFHVQFDKPSLSPKCGKEANARYRPLNPFMPPLWNGVNSNEPNHQSPLLPYMNRSSPDPGGTPAAS